MEEDIFGFWLMALRSIILESDGKIELELFEIFFLSTWIAIVVEIVVM